MGRSSECGTGLMADGMSGYFILFLFCLVHSFNVCHAKVAVGSMIGGFSPDHRNGKRHTFYFTRKLFSQRGRTSITNDVRCPELVLVSQFTTEIRIINFLNFASNPFSDQQS